jgi:hypothetical protein
LNNLDLFNKLDSIERNLLVAKGNSETLENRLAVVNEEITQSQKLVSDLQIAISFLTQTSKKARDNATKSIESLGTLSVRTIFDDPISVRLRYKDKSRTDSSDKLKLQIVTTKPDGTEEITGLMDEVGGGLIETVSHSLRMAFIKWLGYKGPIILDETYKSISNDEKLEHTANLLATTHETVGNQIIFATHKQDIFGDIASKMFLVTKVNNVSVVVEC